MHWVHGLIGLTFLTAACAAAAPAAAAPAAELVRDGVAVGEFVLPADAGKAERFAVDDVRHWVREMTGADVPAVAAASDRTNTKVFVGTRFAGAFADDLAKLAGNDGFAVRRKGGDVYVFGSRPRGTMYGLFALLERNTDIIWARPNPEVGTVFGTRGDLSLDQADFREVPAFFFRSLGGGHPFDVPTGHWQLRNRNNQIGRGFHEPEWDTVQTLGANLATPMAGHFKEHPEYFGFDPVKGTRKGVVHGEGTLCLSHPGVVELWAKEVARQVRERQARTGRTVDVYLIGPGDNWFCCRCDACTKPVKLPGGRELAMRHPDAEKDPLFRSTQIFAFLNRGTEILKTELPDTKLAALAYIHMAEPPAVDIHPDLLVYFAPYPTNNMHFPLLDERQPAEWRERFKAWQRKTKNLGFYEYFYSKPSPLGFYAAANLQALLEGGADPSKSIAYAEFDNDHGARGIGENAAGWDVGAMNTWVIARLFWDPAQDVDALYRYYVRRTYREAAPQMTQYYEMIRNSWLDPTDRSGDGAHASIAGIYANMIVKKGLEARCRTLLAEAEAAAKHPNSKALIRRMREQYAGFSKGMNRLIVAGVPEMAHDGDTFASVQWEKPEALDEFRVVRRYGPLKEPAAGTTVKAAHDGRNLYVRVSAAGAGAVGGADPAAASPAGHAEAWPKGERFELWFARGRTRYAFAFDPAGRAYDARDYDRDWNSGWRVVTRPAAGGWEAIAVIPMSALGLKPEDAAGLQWMAVRIADLASGGAEESSYKGTPLDEKYFPVVVE